MFASRAAHWHTTIAPALAAGRDVVCDRFVDSSYAYRGAGKGVAASGIKALEKLAIDHHRPALTLLLDIDPEEGLRRAWARGEDIRFEQETVAYIHTVRYGFLERAKAEPPLVRRVDAARAPDPGSA